MKLSFGVFGGRPCELSLVVHTKDLPPAPPRAHVAAMLPRIRLVLNATTFYPGATVTGMVLMSLHSPLSVDELFIGIDGHTTSGFSYKASDNLNIPIACDSTHINRTSTLVGTIKKDPTTPITPTVIPPGFHKFAFHYTLPMDLSPSLSRVNEGNTIVSKSGHVATIYSIYLCAHRPSTSDATINAIGTQSSLFGAMGASILAQEPIRILSTPFIAPQHTLDATSSTNLNIGKLTISGLATMTAGTEYKLGVSLENFTSASMDYLTVELQLNVENRVFCKNANFMNNTRHVQTVTLKSETAESWTSPLARPVLQGSPSTFEIPLTVKSTHAPTIPSVLNPCVQYSYYISVTARSKAGNVQANMPIYMSPMPDTSMAMPAEPMGIPGDMIVHLNPPQEMVDAVLDWMPEFDGKSIKVNVGPVTTDIPHLEGAVRTTGLQSVSLAEVKPNEWTIGQTLPSQLPQALPDFTIACAQYPLGYRAPVPQNPT